MDSKLSDCERELTTKWTSDMVYKKKPYREPFLDSATTMTVKRICEKTAQDTYVFFHAVDMLEKYIEVKNADNVEIDDPMLVVTTIVMLAAKYEREQDLNLYDFQQILNEETKCEYPISSIKTTEVDILKTLQTLQLQKVSDDLLTFIKMFEDVYLLKVSLVPLAINTLELLYLKKKKWFFRLKKMYENNNGGSLFITLMRTRCYIPIGVLGFLLRKSNYQHCFDVEGILKIYSEDISIHMDHINLLISQIEAIYENK